MVAVLVVEDVFSNTRAYRRALVHAGFSIIEVANAVDAIAILYTCREIDLVFTDIDMPGSMNGLKLASAVRDR